MNEIDEGDVYRIIGEDGFARLVHAFYAQVPSDPILGAMYPKHDLAAAEQRLRDFLRRATSSSGAIRGCACGTCRSSSTRRRGIGGWR
jgi:truncated hemoglobin YjbI